MSCSARLVACGALTRRIPDGAKEEERDTEESEENHCKRNRQSGCVLLEGLGIDPKDEFLPLLALCDGHSQQGQQKKSMEKNLWTTAVPLLMAHRVGVKSVAGADPTGKVGFVGVLLLDTDALPVWTAVHGMEQSFVLFLICLWHRAADGQRGSAADHEPG